jgi:hypothetical protein
MQHSNYGYQYGHKDPWPWSELPPKPPEPPKTPRERELELTLETPGGFLCACTKSSPLCTSSREREISR